MAASRDGIGWKRWIVAFLYGLVLHLYTAFVAQSLWNWFATKALNVASISFWVCYGCIMLIHLLAAGLGDWQQEQRFKVLFAILEGCIPDNRREWVSEQMEDIKKFAWVDVIAKSFGVLVGNTTSLVLGWVIYTAFM